MVQRIRGLRRARGKSGAKSRVVRFKEDKVNLSRDLTLTFPPVEPGFPIKFLAC